MMKSTDGYLMKCVNCPVGTYYNKTSDLCESCPLGFYQDDEANLLCKPCPDGLTTASERSWNHSQCIASCNLGYFSPAGLEPCEPCDFGSYSSLPRAIRCDNCFHGSSTLSVASSSFLDCKSICEPGSYNDTHGLKPCTACPKNTYQPNSGAKICIECPGTMETSSAGAGNISYCFVVDQCASNTDSLCYNDGSCINRREGFDCQCPPGFSGERCETNINECLLSPCSNNATCLDGLNDYSCLCAEGYSGNNCETEIDECSSSPCLHGGSCLDFVGHFECYCTSGYSGTFCELNNCTSDPCHNGTCVQLTDGLECRCNMGFVGQYCEFMIDECVSRPCQNDASCESFVNGYKCHCLPGFTGTNCESVFNPCDPTPCSSNATCISIENGFQCICPVGYSGTHCETVLSSDFDLIFGEDATSYAKLFLYSPLSTITVCFWMRSSDNWHYGTPMSYASDSNWIGGDNSNAFTLTDYAHFKLFVNGEMVQTGISTNDGAWHHVCVGWQSEGGRWQIHLNGTLKESGTNVATGTYIQSGGVLVLGQEQDSVGGSFAFREAFVGEISQFNIYNHILDDQAIASISNASVCSMESGNVVAWPDVLNGLNGDVVVRNRSYCLDINECQYPDQFYCGSHHECTDLPGTYTCDRCKPGYYGADCQLSIDECSMQPCLNNATCEDGPEYGDYVCHCVLGFTGLTCEDEINFCESEPCLNNGICKQKINDFECVCPQPDMGKRCENKFGHCSPNRCQHGGLCQDRESSFECLCPENYEGTYCELQTDFCLSTPCKNGATCVLVENGFRCECPPSWKGKLCSVLYNSSCLFSPCLNGGLCKQALNHHSGYECICPNNGSDKSWGPNCETLLPCDSNPCQNLAICINLNNVTEYRCSCTEGYTGWNCENPVVTQDVPIDLSTTATSTETSPAVVTQDIQPVHTSTTVQDYCASVSCLHGGTCVNEGNGFLCICKKDYMGQYCKSEREKDTSTYHVVVTLLINYDEAVTGKRMKFESSFRKQIHTVYLDSLKNSKLEVVINSIKSGSVIVDFDLSVTSYKDVLRQPTMSGLKTVLHNHLKNGQLGIYSVTDDGFIFELVEDTGLSNDTLFLIIGCVICALLFILAITIAVVIFRRKYQEKRTIKQRSEFIVHPVTNPAYIGESLQNVELLHAHSPTVNDNVYAELHDVMPYAVSVLDDNHKSNMAAKMVCDEYLLPAPGGASNKIEEDMESDGDDYLVPSPEKGNPRYVNQPNGSRKQRNGARVSTNSNNSSSSDYLDIRTPLPSDFSPGRNVAKFSFSERKLPPVPSDKDLKR